MTGAELRQLIAQVQAQRSELVNVEVKAAKGGTPKRCFEAMSAFAQPRMPDE
jgi:hypothetical protein